MLTDSCLTGKDIFSDILTSPIRRLTSIKLMTDSLVNYLLLSESKNEIILDGKNLSRTIEMVFSISSNVFLEK
jgi:hypothetical protein